MHSLLPDSWRNPALKRCFDRVFSAKMWPWGQSFVRFQETRRGRAQISKAKPIYLLTLLLNSTTWRLGKWLKLEITQVSKQVSCSYDKICSNGSILIWAWMSEMLVHVLIQTAITFEILKSYRVCCIFLPIKDYSWQLCRLEVSARSQVLKISF